VKNVAIIERGKLIGQWNVSASIKLFSKMNLMCRAFGEKPWWGDHYRTLKRRIDPPYVISRNGARQRRLVLIDLDAAPANYLEELQQLYEWEKKP
jgi:hypothetical protein